MAKFSRQTEFGRLRKALRQRFEYGTLSVRPLEPLPRACLFVAGGWLCLLARVTERLGSGVERLDELIHQLREPLWIWLTRYQVAKLAPFLIPQLFLFFSPSLFLFVRLIRHHRTDKAKRMPNQVGPFSSTACLLTY
jgi:hypothetical protein